MLAHVRIGIHGLYRLAVGAQPYRRFRGQDKNVAAPSLGVSSGKPDWNWRALEPQMSLLFYAYGTYATLQPQPPIEKLRSVTIKLNGSSTVTITPRTEVRLLNEPEMP